MRVLFLLFAILPIIEIALLVQVGGLIGGWNTIGLVIITAFVGAYLVRREGFQTLQAAQSKMQQHELPGKEMVEGLLLVIAGVLLVTPGFVTDIIGFLFVVPGSRHLLAAQLSKHLKMRVVTPGQFGQTGGFGQGPSDPFGQRHQPDDGDVFEGEYDDKTQQDDPNKRLK
ncbi:FxsA family protein [Alteromonas sp. ASW11-19]|uniref:FxsA family protein n=1 Tax=Alteromonas salexigens TaxID=2982530 RepID=A0ABT2VJP3_9ALTE|nr:FxsA family protein [Alteromonas salexigens]MCU7553467.1 FxsA family protein [Alteromonas salexigens]